jgi:hypothetical protein
MGPRMIWVKMFLRGLKSSVKPQWMLLGDFNLIYKEQDKNNGRLNRQMMLRFRRALHHMEVKEVDLLDRKYTWSSNYAIPTLCRIDRVFFTPAWEDLYPNPMLQTLSSSSSDHCPMVLMPLSTPPFKPIFRFETFCPTLPGYHDCVQQVWNKSILANQNPLGISRIKLSRTAKALKACAKSFIQQITLALAICREVAGQMEKVQEHRTWTATEQNLIKRLKSRILGLAAIERSRAPQKSRLTWLRLGDANTKLFHMVANNRKKNNFIYSLQSYDGVALTQRDKHTMIFYHFLKHLGSYAPEHASSISTIWVGSQELYYILMNLF